MTRLFGPSAAARPVLLVVVILALILAVVAAGLILRSQRPFPPRGLIAFASPEGMDVRIVSADGTVSRAVTSTPLVIEHAPRWSPDGRTLLFVRHANGVDQCTGEGSIALYDIATQRERTIASGARAIVAAEWSPTGDEIAFLRQRPDCSSLEQGVVDVANGGVTIAPTVHPVRPSPTTRSYNPWLLLWTDGSPSAVDLVGAEVASPDGRYVVTLGEPTRDAGGRVTVRDRDTGAEVELGNGAQPVWSPDGSALAFVQPINGPPEYDIQYRDHLVVATAGTWQIRSLAEVADPAVNGADPEPILPVFWTRDGRAMYWLDTLGGHVVDVASGRTKDLPKEVQGCNDLQWQPLPEPA